MRWLRRALSISACVCQFLLLPAFGQIVIDTVRTGATPLAIAVDNRLNRIYVVNQGSNSLTVVDGVSDSSVNVGVGQYPTAVAVNLTTGKAYVVNRSDNTVTVIQPADYSQRTVATGKWPQVVAINAATNGIYITNEGDSSMTVLNGVNDSLIGTVPVGRNPDAIAVNVITNKIYVANRGSNTVTVIDGPTLSTASINVGSFPYAIAVNQLTNQIYVANYSGTVTVIDGASNLATTVAGGSGPDAVAVNPVTNLVYVANSGDGTVTVIDGGTLVTSSVLIGSYPGVLAVDAVTNKVYVTDLQAAVVSVLDGASNEISKVYTDSRSVAVGVNPVSNRIYAANELRNTVSVIAGAPASPLQFVPVVPCRVVDTRNAIGPFGGPSMAAGSTRSFAIPMGPCDGIPEIAAAYSLNVTVVPHGGLAYLTIWPTGENQPAVSTMNSLDGRIKANAVIVPAGASSAVSVFVTNATDVVLDINGYFVPASSPGAMAFYPIAPCRVADTRNANGPLGGPSLSGGVQREFPVQASSCQIPSTSQAYSMNFTVVPKIALAYLTVWPSGEARPSVSTLNAMTGTVVANAAIVPAGSGGDIDVYATQDTDLVIDINGYFAAPGAGGLALYPTAPCRTLDTRQSSGAFTGTLTIPLLGVLGNPCGLSATAKNFVLNATTLPVGGLAYLTLWADGRPRPQASTLNAVDGAFTSNMAIVPGGNGAIDAYASGVTQLLLDISSYFAP